MNRIKLLLLLAAFLFNGQLQGGNLYRVNGFAFARIKPNPNSLIFFVIDSPDTLASLSEFGNWIQITSPKDAKKSGWVRKSDLTLLLTPDVLDTTTHDRKYTIGTETSSTLQLTQEEQDNAAKSSRRVVLTLLLIFCLIIIICSWLFFRSKRKLLPTKLLRLNHRVVQSQANLQSVRPIQRS